TGATGPTGPCCTGPTGPTGPVGSGGIFNFISVVADDTTTTPNGPANTQTIANGDHIFYPTTVAQGGSITYLNGVFTAMSTDPATYEITYGGRWTGINGETNPIISLKIDSTVQSPGQVIGNSTGGQGDSDWTVISLIFTLPAGTHTFEILSTHG